MQIILYKKDVRAQGFIMQPFFTENNGNKMLHVLIDGFMYSFYLNSRSLSEDRKEPFLKEDGTAQIIGRIAMNDPGLFQLKKGAFDYFKTIQK